MIHSLVSRLLFNVKYVFYSKTLGLTDPSQGFRPIVIEEVLQRVNDNLFAAKYLAIVANIF